MHREHGLDSALAAPRHLLAYGTPDLCDLAAKYAAALTHNHPFRDGNKRVALTVAGVFVEMNGRRLEVPEPDAVQAVVALAAGRMDEPAFAAWLRHNSADRPRGRRATTRNPKRSRVTPKKRR